MNAGPTDNRADQTPIGDARHQDPILVKRARMANLARLGVRVGSALFALAAVLFVVALLTTFSPLLTTVISIGLLAGSAILAPAMVLSYTVKAADRADRDGTW